MKRMQHLAEWEEWRGTNIMEAAEEEMNRNTAVEEEEDPLRCKVQGCGRVCKSRVGLRIHIKRMHEEARRFFAFSRCGSEFNTEGNKLSHEKTCSGVASGWVGLARCEKCNKDISKASITRHRRACTAGEGDGGETWDRRGWLKPECIDQEGRYASCVEWSR